MDLGEFLLARIAEDEEEARALLPVYDGMISRLKSPAIEQLALAPHFARHDPARVLAECEAKRRIVEDHPEITVWSEGENYNGDRINEPEWYCGRCVHTNARQPWTDVDRVESPCPTLRLLALPYADHPDYRPEWKP